MLFAENHLKYKEHPSDAEPPRSLPPSKPPPMLASSVNNNYSFGLFQSSFHNYYIT